MSNNEYVIDKIVEKRKVGRTVEYRVRWEGFDEGGDTWEPRSKLAGYDAVNEFEEKLRKENKLAAESKRSAAVQVTAERGAKVEESSQRTQRRVPAAVRDQTQTRSFTAAREEDFRSSNGEAVEMPVGESSAPAPVPVPVARVGHPDLQFEEPYEGKQYKVQSGSRVRQIIGVRKSFSPNFGVVALLQYEDGSFEIVPTTVLAEHCPKIVIAYYDARVVSFQW